MPAAKPNFRRRLTVVEAPGQTAAQRLVDYFVVVSSVPRWHSRPALARQRRRKRFSALPRVGRNVPKKLDVDLQEKSSDESPPGIEPPSTEGNIHMAAQQQAGHAFQPKITARYPITDHPDNPLNPMIIQFCHPCSDIIEPRDDYVMPRVHHFVLTNDKGRKIYGTCLTIYEEFIPPKDTRMCWDRIHSDDGEVEVTDGQHVTLYLPKVLCVLSTWPYLTAFREYLTQLYRLATTTNLMTTPIERHVMNFCSEIPAPPPGAFEIQVSILTSTIRFWAPPAKLPVAFVALPYQTLFDCLDLENILQVWYALTLERKVLLLSSQHSILSVCSEILCSLLFPFSWSHLYIPLLPQLLSPMLDAPVPYLVGVIRDNWWLAEQHVNEETIVVDLDRNLVTMGELTEPLPPAPPKKYDKLKAELEQAAGNIFMKTRGVEKDRRRRSTKKLDKNGWEQALAQGDTRWNEKLKTYDDAIHLAYAPESPNLLNDVDDCHQSQWDRVQESFLRFFVAVLKVYRKFLDDNDDSAPEVPGSRWNRRQTFDREGFVSSQKADNKPFLSELCLTQQFDDFVTKRIYSPGEPDVIFFDQKIDEKLNRSKLKLKKLDTPFLHSAQAHKVLKVQQAVEPNSEGLPERNEPYVYKEWPSTFDESLFCRPRPIPGMITAEFDRQTTFVMNLRAKYASDDQLDNTGDLNLSHFNPSAEVATFTVFFMTYSAVIGREWQKYVIKCLNADETEFMASEDDAEYQEALAVAAAQLDLAFEVLYMMEKRELPVDPEAVKCLMEACGRCGDAERATELLEIIKRDGLIADSEMYSSFLSAFAYGVSSDIESPGSIEEPRRGSDAYAAFLKKKWAASKKPSTVEESFLNNLASFGSECELTSVSDSGSDFSYSAKADVTFGSSSGIFGDCYDFISVALGGWAATPTEKPLKKIKRRKSRRRRKRKPAFDGLIVSDKVKKQVSLGENLMDFLYPDLVIDTKSDACPQCSRVLTETEVVAAWLPRQFSDFTTGCPDCKHRFVPRFVVKSTGLEGSQGTGTPLFCEFLSPWVLIKELKQDVDSVEAVEEMLDPEWRQGTHINATLWWNLVISCMRYRLPISFLLQGSFQNRLINPDPETLM